MTRSTFVSYARVVAFLVLSWAPGSRFFLKLNDVFNALLVFSREGAVFVFGSLFAGAFYSATSILGIR